MTSGVDGFYTAYLSAAGGQGLLMFVIREGQIVGADTVGAQLDGSYRDGAAESLEVDIVVRTPPNIPLVQGGNSGPSGLETHLHFPLPMDFASLPFVRIDGSRGPVNAKFVKLRGLP